MPDEPTRIGPHLLGRIYKPDARDWSPEHLHRQLSLGHAGPPDTIADMTVRDIVTKTPYLSSWSALLAFWRWLKSFFVHPSPPPKPPADVTPAWDDPVTLDQGNYGTCVGNGWAGWMAAAPVEDPGVDEALARAIYYDATCFDGKCDPSGQNGSTVRSGAKAVQKRGRLTAYAFASKLADVDEWLNNHGPVVFGTDWYDSMFTPDPNGWLKVAGSVAGGHCFLCLDKLDDEDGYLFVNSWGTGWGQNGRFKIHTADVAALLAAQGEACLAAELPL